MKEVLQFVLDPKMVLIIHCILLLLLLIEIFLLFGSGYVLIVGPAAALGISPRSHEDGKRTRGIRRQQNERSQRRT